MRNPRLGHRMADFHEAVGRQSRGTARKALMLTALLSAILIAFKNSESSVRGFLLSGATVEATFGMQTSQREAKSAAEPPKESAGEWGAQSLGEEKGDAERKGLVENEGAIVKMIKGSETAVLFNQSVIESGSEPARPSPSPTPTAQQTSTSLASASSAAPSGAQTEVPTAPAKSDPSVAVTTKDPVMTATCQPDLKKLGHTCLQRAEAAMGSRQAWAKGVVDVNYVGQMGNVMFEVAFASVVADAMKYTVRFSNEQIQLDNHEAVSNDTCTEWTLIDQTQDPCGHLVTAFEKVSIPGHCVRLEYGFWQRYALYQPYKARVKQLMHSQLWDKEPQPVSPGPNDVVIHVRFETDPDVTFTFEDLRSNRFYPALTLEYYDNVLAHMKPWDNLWVICTPKIAAGKVVQYLVTKYGAKVQSGDKYQDFAFLKHAKRLVLAVSTFSWWAAWLSDAWEIHYPIAGLLHPISMWDSFDNDIPGQIAVFDEERYVYHDLLSRKWWGHFDQCSNGFVYDYEDPDDGWTPEVKE